jgi:hypothetical protein
MIGGEGDFENIQDNEHTLGGLRIAVLKVEEGI